MKTYLNPDGTLRLVTWAEASGAAFNHLVVPNDERPHAMAHSNATGRGLVSNGELGVDEIRLEAGDAFQPHTHPGDHLLIVVAGLGTITYNGKIYPTMAGQVYMVEGAVPHAVGAITEHVILAVGSPHKPVDSIERMTPVAYEAVAVDIGELHCLICDKLAFLPAFLHDTGCPHCPCADCNPVKADQPTAGHHSH